MSTMFHATRYRYCIFYAGNSKNFACYYIKTFTTFSYKTLYITYIYITHSWTSTSLLTQTPQMDFTVNSRRENHTQTGTTRVGASSTPPSSRRRPAPSFTIIGIIEELCISTMAKRMSANEKRNVILDIYHKSKAVYTEKEILSLATKAGVNSNT
jgi:hypothetical protein